MSLGEKLRSLRRKEKRTMRSQSELCGVKPNTIFRWEHDRAIPRTAELKKIAELHSVPLAWLTQDCAAIDHVECSYIDLQFFSLFDKLTDSQKYMILGYIERVYAEGQNGTVACTCQL